jgi:GT2 family glycosyltransferase
MAADTGLASGAIQGADMFLHRSAFNKIGMFNDAMGVGTPFGCEDIEMATRASLAGFVGALVPFIGLTHHHWRLRDSKETNAVVIAYDYVRGAYYASLLDNGVANV